MNTRNSCFDILADAFLFGRFAPGTHPARALCHISPTGGAWLPRRGELYKIHLLYSLHSYKVHNARINGVYLPQIMNKRPEKLHKEHSGKYTFPEGEQSARLSTIRAGDHPRVPSPMEHRRGEALRRRSKGLGRFPTSRGETDFTREPHCLRGFTRAMPRLHVCNGATLALLARDAPRHARRPIFAP